MNDTLVTMAAEVLDMSEGEVREHTKEVPEVDGFFVWNPARGGRSMVVNRQGERLVAKGFVSFEQHVQDFLAGRRN